MDEKEKKLNCLKTDDSIYLLNNIAFNVCINKWFKIKLSPIRINTINVCCKFFYILFSHSRTNDA